MSSGGGTDELILSRCAAHACLLDYMGPDAIANGACFFAEVVYAAIHQVGSR